jgi:hypothetical protein
MRERLRRVPDVQVSFANREVQQGPIRRRLQTGWTKQSLHLLQDGISGAEGYHVSPVE